MTMTMVQNINVEAVLHFCDVFICKVGGQVGISPESRHRVADWRKKVQLENKKREIHSARREIHSVGREINSVGQLGRTKNTQQFPLTLEENYQETYNKGRGQINFFLTFWWGMS